MGPEMSQKMSVCMCVTGRRDNMYILRNVEVILLNTSFGFKKKKAAVCSTSTPSKYSTV